MRNLLLTLVLANVLLLAWQLWIEPSAGVPSDGPGQQTGGRLDLFTGAVPPRPAAMPRAAAAPASPVAGATGSCLRVGPLPGEVAAEKAGAALVSQGIDASPMARDGQVWLGHWVQIPGFSNVAAAEAARQRLAANGIADAYLMQDGPEPMVSLGVFRDRTGADRVAAAAQGLGFRVSIRDRYRPTVEQWLMVRLRPGQSLPSSVQDLTGDRIVRTEAVACGDGSEAGGQTVGARLPTRPD